MKALVIKSFRNKDSGRVALRRDIINVSKERFAQLKGTFLEEAPKDAVVSPHRDKNGVCLTCKKLK